jgi:hypothetical protein
LQACTTTHKNTGIVLCQLLTLFENKFFFIYIFALCSVADPYWVPQRSQPEVSDPELNFNLNRDHHVNEQFDPFDNYCTGTGVLYDEVN